MEAAKARCEMAADGTSTGYLAFGSPEFVGGAAIGNGLNNLFNHARAYDQCMTMLGYAHN